MLIGIAAVLIMVWIIFVLIKFTIGGLIHIALAGAILLIIAWLFEPKKD